MRRLVLAAAALLAASVARAQDDAELARGQKYLDAIGAAWAKQAPFEQRIALYMGRKYIGHLTLSVKPDDGGFAASLAGEMNFMGSKMTGDARAVLTKTLAPVSMESTDDEGTTVKKRQLKVEDGHWTLTTDTDGKVETTQGDLHAGSTWGGLFPFAAFLTPPDADEPLQIHQVGSDKPYLSIKATTGKRKLTIGGKEAEYAVLEATEGKGKPDLWFLGADGAVVEVRPEGMPVRMRVIAEDAIGKDLDEPLKLRGSEKAVIALFHAIKKQDRKNVEKAFDFGKLASTNVPGYEGLPEADKQATVEKFRKTMVDGLMKNEAFKGLPDDDVMDDFLAAVMKTSQKGDKSTVSFGPDQKWKLYRPTEGAHKGKWLIYGVK